MTVQHRTAMPSSSHPWRLAAAVALLSLAALHPVAQAAEFHLYVKCKGTLSASGQSKPAHLDQTPTDYTMVYQLRQPGTHYYHDWLNGTWVVWQPNLKRLATIRLAIDRQEGELEGELLDFDDDLIGTMKMTCDKVDPDELPEPKF